MSYGDPVLRMSLCVLKAKQSKTVEIGYDLVSVVKTKQSCHYTQSLQVHGSSTCVEVMMARPTVINRRILVVALPAACADDEAYFCRRRRRLERLSGLLGVASPRPTDPRRDARPRTRADDDDVMPINSSSRESPAARLIAVRYLLTDSPLTTTRRGLTFARPHDEHFDVRYDRLVAWNSGRTSVFRRRTFAVLQGLDL